MGKINYRHDNHDGYDEWLHIYAEALIDRVWAGLNLRALADTDYTYLENRAYARAEIRRAIGLSNTVSGSVEQDNNVCLRFTLEHEYGPDPIRFWVQWDTFKQLLAQQGTPLDL